MAKRKKKSSSRYKYGDTVVDAAGRSGIARFDERTGRPLRAPREDSGNLFEDGFDDSDIRGSYRDASRVLGEQRDYYRQRGAEDLTRIGTEYAASADTLGRVQNREYAGRSTSLVTSGGGFLGATQSQEGVLSGLQRDHQTETQALYQKRDAAISNSRNAYMEKDFAFAKEQANLAVEMEKEINTAKDRFATRQLAMTQEKRAAGAAEQTWASNALETWASGAAPVDLASKERAAKAYGTNEAGIDALLSGQKAVTKAKNEKERTAALQAMVSLTRDIPAGVKISDGNGGTITGWGQSGDWDSRDFKDKYGNVVNIRTNKITNQEIRKNLGQIDKPSESASDGGYKFSNESIGRLVGAGTKLENIRRIESDLNALGAPTVLARLKQQMDNTNNTAVKASINEVIKTIRATLLNDEFGFSVEIPEFSYNGNG